MFTTTIFTSAIAFAVLSSAQSTISLFVPGADVQPLVASIVGSDTVATTYAIECVPGTDSNNCGISGVVLLTEGPATAAYTMSDGYTNASTSVLLFTGYFDCSLAGTTSAVCTNSFGGNEANFPGMATETLAATDITYMPVIITAGQLVTTGTGVSNTAAAPSTTKTTATTSNTSGSSGTITKSESGSGTAQTQTSTAKSSASTGAAPVVRGKVQWVVGGGAVAMALIR